MSKRGFISGLTLCVALLVAGCNQPNTPSNAGNSTQKSNYTNATLEEGEVAFKEKKYDIAEGIFAKFCSDGNIEACVKQGQVYATDERKDTAKAFPLFKNACEKGNANGCNRLGIIYISNTKEGNDPLKGIEYFKKSCGLGAYAGCRNAALHYSLGRYKEVPQDIALAAEYMTKACSLGDQKSCEEAEELKHRLSLNGKATLKEKIFETEYTGNFVNGKYHGKGILTFRNGKRYEGDFVNGQQTGKGIYIYSNGDRYEGDVNCGKHTGIGIYIWKDSGSVYEGEWMDDKRTGYGIMKINKNNTKAINSYPKYSGNYEGNFYVIKGEFNDDKFIETAPIPMELQQRIDADAKADFEYAQKTATLDAYTNFMKKRPNSTYVTKITALIDQKIEPEYKKAVSTKDVTALKEFSEKYSYSTKSKEATKVIETIEEAKRKKEAEIVAQREAKERVEREKIAAKERKENAENERINKLIHDQIKKEFKFIAPSDSICEQFGGHSGRDTVLNVDGCVAKAKNAEKICQKSGGRLMREDEFRKFAMYCNYNFSKDYDNSKNTKYINCLAQYGIRGNIYHLSNQKYCSITSVLYVFDSKPDVSSFVHCVK